MTVQTGMKPAETDEQGMARHRRYAASLRLPAAQCSRSTDLACGERCLLCYPLLVLVGGLVSSRVVTPEQNMSLKWDHNQMPPAGTFSFFWPALTLPKRP
jgi:hypothetical protein